MSENQFFRPQNVRVNRKPIDRIQLAPQSGKKIPSILSDTRRAEIKEVRKMSEANRTIREHKSYFSDEQLASLDSGPDDADIMLSPDMSSLAPTSTTEIGQGKGFSVYKVDESRVIKVERVAIRKDPKTGAMSTHYPWMTIGMDRHPLHTIKDAIVRKKIHLANKERMAAAGIKTADYVGSLLLPSLPLTKEPAVIITPSHQKKEAPVKQEETPELEASRRIARDLAQNNPPMYAEIWENVRGVPLEKNEALVDELYETPEGRDLLRQVALSILKLTRQGFVCDVDTRIQIEDSIPINTVARTKKDNPFPRNFFIRKIEGTDRDELVAIDFNMGLDLAKEPWWREEYSAVVPLMRSTSNGKIYPPHNLREEMRKRLRETFYHPPLNILTALAEGDVRKLRRIELEKEVYYDQIDKLYSQAEVSAAILAKIEEITGEKENII